MKRFTKTAIASAISLAAVQATFAGTDTFFIPLTKPEIVEPADSVDERNQPWSMPYGLSQSNLTSMEEVENDVNQSIVRVPAGNVSSMFDMLDYDPSGRYIFIPHETPSGAGVSRYDTETDTSQILFMGDQTGTEGFKNNTDFGAFDPVRLTPNGSLIAGEEWAGTGRLVEICDAYADAPFDPVAGGSELVEGDCATDRNADWRVLDGIPLVAWEGNEFSIKRPQKVLYYVDEDRSGSIYKTVFKKPGQYNEGKTFVLVADKFSGDPAERWDREPNIDSVRTGWAQWVPITDKNGKPLEGIQDPTELILDDAGDIVDAGLAGRLAADQVNGTPYGRPEDMVISTLGRGGKRRANEIIYFTATSENAVYSVEETRRGPYIRLFASADTTPLNEGFEPTTASFNAPDNLAIDKLGNIYVIEDSPNTTTVGADGGDIWFARDADNDGVAESLDHFLSLQVNQSEATGMIFDPVEPTKFIVAVQHPASTGLQDETGAFTGFGDAIWEFDLAGVIPPECNRDSKVTIDEATGRRVRACEKSSFFNLIKVLEGDYPKGDRKKWRKGKKRDDG